MKTLETKRLILRDWNESDLDDLYDYARVEGVGEMAGWPHHQDKEVSKCILEGFINKKDVYAVVYREANKVIGSVGIHTRIVDESYKGSNQRELGYVLSQAYWGKGLMTEAVKVVIKHSFEVMAIDMIGCRHYVMNNLSKRVIEKCGFIFVEDCVCELKLLNKTLEGKRYKLTKEDYELLKVYSE